MTNKISLAPGSVDVSRGIVKSQIFEEMSDINLKTNIEEISSALKKVMSLKGYTYIWKRGHVDANHRVIGFIAQEMADVYPEVKLSN